MDTDDKPKKTKVQVRPKKHGILVLHGAGMPDYDKTLVGDPLSTIANGLIDYLNDNHEFHARYREATKAEMAGRDLTQLDIDIYRKGGTGNVEVLEHEICMREALWKPTMRKQGLLDYIPLLWLWAFAFQSNTIRKTRGDARVRQRDEKGVQELETVTHAARRGGDFWSRFWLAVLGLASTLFWVGLARVIVTSLIPTDQSGIVQFVRTWQIVPSIISASVVAAVLLIILALEESRDRSAKSESDKPSRPHGRLHMLAIILTTAWLAIFLLPILLLSYYLDRLLTMVIVIGFTAGALAATLRIESWWFRIPFLFLIALIVFVVTRPKYKSHVSSPLSKVVRTDMHSELAGWLTRLLVLAGAPLLILVILALEVLSVIPIAGDTLQKWAQNISQAGSWEALKDIHTIVTDSSRAAEARYAVEQGIKDLADADTIHVFSHSLGTVVAYDTLVHLGRADGTVINSKDEKSPYWKIKTLVTYGCPLNKIRILANFAAQSSQVSDIMAGLDYTRFDDSATLPARKDWRWLNFYSVQDVVSDFMSLYYRTQDPVHPVEYSVPSAKDIATAHGVYWTDDLFWAESLKALGIA